MRMEEDGDHQEDEVLEENERGCVVRLDCRASQLEVTRSEHASGYLSEAFSASASWGTE